GQWLDLHRQTWTANSSGTLAFVDGAWNDLFGGVAKANLMIDVASKNLTGAKKDSVIAEMRTLRAWYYYMLQDMFGGVPLATTTELKQYPRSTRTDIFAFIDKELTESIPNLPDKWPSSFYGRVTKGAANAILASLYLNAGVFNKNTGVDPAGYNSCTIAISGGRTGCQAAITAADAVINSGTYTLNTDWYQNFSATNKSSPENIFVVVHTKETTQGIGGNWPMRTLHYNQLNTGQGGPWNGFATLAETYNAFTSTDDRRNMWLAGQAYSFETGQPVKDRTGKSLVFSVAIADADTASEATGVRFNKFPPIPSPSVGSAQPNDFTFFRLAEMYLIKAEALNEQGNTAAALTQLNTIHNRHDPTNPITATNQATIRDAILKERLLEFAAEGKRRTDMIRHGRFLTWREASVHGICGATPTVSCPARSAFRILFPIPSPQLGSNPLLTQNPGY